ncbi:MAG: polyprenyl diphosphate synthase [Peptococcaceae bacterium]|nr:polyprenyl diphosphate synthase [Peptococcaceae bacterium]
MVESPYGAGHVAIIMDGNGRWAQDRGLPRAAGHRAGVEALKRIVTACPDLGVRYLTVYAFSTENWKRPPAEVRALMSLLNEFIDKELAGLKKNGVRIRVLGDLTALDRKLAAKIENAVQETKENRRLDLSLALSYGGRQELLRAAKALARRALAGEDPESFREEDLAAELYTADLPDPDLLIRTGGELRTSNFLPWQSVYTELWNTRTFWPDFSQLDLRRALEDFAKRQRRFGGV